MILRASAGTAAKIGFKNGPIPEGLKTAYFMLDGECIFNCQYCTHACSSLCNGNSLSRVVWPQVPDIENLVSRVLSSGFKRICLQIVSYRGYKKDVLTLLNLFGDMRVSVSVRAKNIREVEEYFAAGADRVSVSLDVATPRLYTTIRGGTLQNTLDLLRSSSSQFSGRITTHVIVGLGETDREIINLFFKLKEINVTTALFAFTPIKGTALQNRERPSVLRYRKIQLARYMIYSGYNLEDFIFDENTLAGFKQLPKEPERAFLTSGCPDCTRPFYNEKPNGVLYNIHTERLLKDLKVSLKTIFNTTSESSTTTLEEVTE